MTNCSHSKSFKKDSLANADKKNSELIPGPGEAVKPVVGGGCSLDVCSGNLLTLLFHWSFVGLLFVF